MDRLANRVYGSRYNPLYQSGTIAVLLLAVLLATGLWLLLFYRIGAPWTSVAALTDDRWTGNWVRGLHRYASDGAVVAVVVHLVRMFLQRRSHGPRLLAWLTGVGLLGLLFVCGWTGFVLVWDQFGEVLAVEGARIIDALPMLAKPLQLTFVGDQPIPSAFYFVNLFLHVALPLGLGLGLWLHVSRLARPSLLPPRAVTVAIVGGLTAIAMVRPLAMAPEANPFVRALSVPVDWFYAFWLPLHAALPPWGAWLGVSILVGALVVVPWLTRAPKESVEPSRVDSRACTGCEQCAHDCPYEAIAMVPRADGRAKLVAKVAHDRCVSCGICAGSCDVLAVGPPGRSGRDQAEWAATTFGGGAIGNRVVVLRCAHSAGDTATDARVMALPVACVGSVHTGVIAAALAGGARGVVLAGCPSRDCWHREGPRWAAERLAGQRDARLTGVAPGLVWIVDGSEPGAVGDAVARIGLGPDGDPAPERLASEPGSRHRVLGGALALIASAVLVVGSIAPWRSHTEEEAVVRLAWSARPQRLEHCRRLSDQELAGVPAHMRERVHCEGRAARYAITATVDGTQRLVDTVRGGGARHEGMIHLLRDILAEPGQRRVRLELVRLDSAVTTSDSLGTPASGREQRMEATRERVRREALPTRVLLDTVLSVAARAVVVIGYDPERQVFRANPGPGGPR